MAGHRADMMKLLKQARKQGCTYERARNGHWEITTPNGTIVRAAFSPRNAGGVRQTITDLKKAGVEL